MIYDLEKISKDLGLVFNPLENYQDFDVCIEATVGGCFPEEVKKNHVTMAEINKLSEMFQTNKNIKPFEEALLIDKLVMKTGMPKTVFKLKKQDKTEIKQNKDKKQAAINEMNKEYSMLQMEGQTFIMKSIDDREVFMKPADFRLWFKNKNIWVEKEDGGKRKVNKAELWLDSPDRNEYQGVVFRPGGKIPEHHYNLWKGFAVKPQKGDWHLLEDHIFEYLCNEDTESFEFFIKWCAAVVQHCVDCDNVRRPEVALVLGGIRGIGKDTFADLFGSLFGRHFTVVSQKEHLLGKFNAALQNCVLCHASETFWAGDKQAEGQLKAMITNTDIHFEAKYRSNICLESHLNFIISSNEDWMIPAGAHERRFFVPTLSISKPTNPEYYINLRKSFINGGASAMLHDLLDTSYNPNIFKTPPKTEGLKTQVENTMSLTQQFIYEALQDAGSGDGINLTWGQKVSSEVVFNQFKYFCDKIGHKKRTKSKSAFIKELNSVMGGALNPKAYYIDGVTVRGIDLPDIKNGIHIFNKNMGLELIRDETKELI